MKKLTALLLILCVALGLCACTDAGHDSRCSVHTDISLLRYEMEENLGLDPDALPVVDKSSANFGSSRSKPWKDIWGAGQGVGNIDEVLPVAEIVARLEQEYHGSIQRLNESFNAQEELAR